MVVLTETHLWHLSVSFAWWKQKSSNLGATLLFIPFLDNYQLCLDFERSFILWLHLSATTLIMLLGNLPYLWCSGGKTFSPCNWKGHPDGAFVVGSLVLLLSKQGWRQVNTLQMDFWITGQVPGVSSVTTQVNACSCSLFLCTISHGHSAWAGWLHS